MTRSHGLVLPLLLSLAACASPQQQCVGAATSNLRNIDALILQTQGNLQRGYGYTQVVRNVPQFVPCGGGWSGNNYNNMDMCLVNTVQSFNQPVTIDLVAEQKKLDQLIARRAQVAKDVGPAIAACQAQYPE